MPPAPRDRRSFERVFGWSLAASVLVHLLLLILSPLWIQTEHPPGGEVVADVEAPRTFGIEMIVAVPSEDAPEIPIEELPPPTQQPSRTAPTTQPSQPGLAPAGASPVETPTRSAPAAPGRDALQPGTRDPRLYVQPSPLPPADTRSEHQRYMEHLQARVDAINDSMAVAARRESRTADWTVTDSNGNRWGLSPDGLHLGGVTIPRELFPLPAATGDNATLEADRERQRQRDEIQRQEAERQRRETERERIEAVRNSPRGGGGS